MTLIKWKPNNMIMNDFDYMIDRIFNDGWNYKTTNDSFSPSVDIIEKDDEFILKADFPGFDKKNIELNIENGVLKLNATQDNNYSEDNKFTIQERNNASVHRSFTLPDYVKTDKVSAKYKNGTLEVFIPKKDEVKPSTQTIKIS